MFPAIAIPLVLNHLIVKRMVSVGASLESQERNVTAVLMAISSSKKEVAQVSKQNILNICSLMRDLTYETAFLVLAFPKIIGKASCYDISCLIE